MVQFSKEELEEFDTLAPTMTKKELADYYGVSLSCIRYQVVKRGLKPKSSKLWTDERCRHFIDMYTKGVHHSLIEKEFGIKRGTLGCYLLLCNKHLNINVPFRGTPHKYHKRETTED